MKIPVVVLRQYFKTLEMHLFKRQRYYVTNTFVLILELFRPASILFSSFAGWFDREPSCFKRQKDKNGILQEAINR